MFTYPALLVMPDPCTAISYLEIECRLHDTLGSKTDTVHFVEPGRVDDILAFGSQALRHHSRRTAAYALATANSPSVFKQKHSVKAAAGKIAAYKPQEERMLKARFSAGAQLKRCQQFQKKARQVAATPHMDVANLDLSVHSAQFAMPLNLRRKSNIAERSRIMRKQVSH